MEAMHVTAGKGKSQVAVILGSDSDLEMVGGGLKLLEEFGIGYELRILSAHRTPKETAAYVEGLTETGVKVVIAAAGLSAALPGTVAAHTLLPVIGIPVSVGTLGGLDALLSISQMPPGVPVAAVTIGSPGARNAALLAVRILALSDQGLAGKLAAYADKQRESVLAKDQQCRK